MMIFSNVFLFLQVTTFYTLPVSMLLALHTVCIDLLALLCQSELLVGNGFLVIDVNVLCINKRNT